MTAHLTNGIKPNAARILLYSHDTLGYGHLQRNLKIATALSQLTPQPDILLICGMREAGRFKIPQGVDLVCLPAWEKDSDGHYCARHLSLDNHALRKLRARIIEGAVKGFKPDLIIIDNVPRGAQNELDSVLPQLKKMGTRIVLGLRDVIDRPKVVKQEWQRKKNHLTIQTWFDEVWVYGDHHCAELMIKSGLRFSPPTRFCGYIVPPFQGTHEDHSILRNDKPYALCMVGGGSDGATLCQAFVQAKLPQGWHGLIVLGGQMSMHEQHTIERMIQHNPVMFIRSFEPNLMPLIQGAQKIICMGGYNSMTEVISARRDALIVPRVQPRREQLTRAKMFAKAGLVDYRKPDEINPEMLSAWLQKPDRLLPDLQLDCQGLQRLPEFVKTLLPHLFKSRLSDLKGKRSA